MNGMLAVCRTAETHYIHESDIRWLIQWPIQIGEWTPEIHGTYPDKPIQGTVYLDVDARKWLDLPRRILDKWLGGSWT